MNVCELKYRTNGLQTAPTGKNRVRDWGKVFMIFFKCAKAKKISSGCESKKKDREMTPRLFLNYLLRVIKYLNC